MLSRLKDLFLVQPGDQDDAREHTVELATAALLIEVVKADFKQADDELRLLPDLLARHFSLSSDEVADLVDLAQGAVDKSVSLYEFSQVVDQGLSEQEKIEVVELLWRVAYADKVLDKHEEHLVRKLAELLHVRHADFIKAKHRVEQE